MLTVEDALRLVIDHVQPLAPVNMPLWQARGCVLAEPVTSDVDSPPHDKSLVDGYAVIASDVGSGELRVLEEVTAGAVPTRVVERGTATRIMTGAPVPRGADAVVMVEQTELAGERVRVLQSRVTSGQNIMRRAASIGRGQTVLETEKLLRPMEIGLLAEVGRAMVSAIPAPRVAILATGNELVPASEVPGPGQIRNSNESLLAGLVRQAGGNAVPLGIARDDESELARHIEAGLMCDVLVLSGGVSAGVLDLVPPVLGRLGVTQVFHKVNLKPGKPLWFGVKPLCERHTPLVFGLPGNPVSALVCFELFVRPAIQKLRGLPPTGLRRSTALLAQDHEQRGDRPTYWPAAVQEDRVKPLPWQGSGDLRTLTDANCLALFPGGDRLFHCGEKVELLLLDEPSC